MNQIYIDLESFSLPPLHGTFLFNNWVLAHVRLTYTSKAFTLTLDIAPFFWKQLTTLESSRGITWCGSDDSSKHWPPFISEDQLLNNVSHKLKRKKCKKGKQMRF